MSDRESVDPRQQVPNEQQSEVTQVPQGLDLSLYDIDVSEPFGFGTGRDDPQHPSIIYDKETGFAINNNPVDGEFGDPRVRDLQILMINELDSQGRTNQPSDVLPDFGVDGIWRCETQAAFNRLLDEKGVQNRTVGNSESYDCPGLEQFVLDEKTLEQLKGEKSEEESSTSKDGGATDKDAEAANEVVDLNDQCIVISNLRQILEKSSAPKGDKYPSFFMGSADESLSRDQIRYNRIHKITTTEPATMMNRLRMTRGALEFLGIRHWQLSQLVPTIRIYKQYPQGKNKPPREVEIKFNSFVDPITDLQDMLNSREQRGVGVGIEYLQYSLIGPNPDVAKKQVIGKLAIYAQNFNELFKTRRGFDQDGVEFEGGYRIIDLLLQSLGTAGRINDPNNYSLKIVVGWGASGGGGILEPALVSAIKEMQLTTIVSVGDYDIDIQDDQGGSVRVVLDFYPRLEAVTLARGSDVLADEATRKKRKQRKNIFDKLVRSEKLVDPEKPDGGSERCLSAEQIKELKASYDKDVRRDIQNSQSTLLRKLQESNLIYSLILRTPTDEEVKEQINAIATQTASSLTGELAGSLDLARLMLEFKKNQVVEVLNDAFNDERLKNDRDLLLNPETRMVQYFFLGDLLAVALDNVFEGEDKDIYLGNVKYIMGPVTFQDNNGQDITINIADIPISVDLFVDFMAKKMPTGIESGTAYPLYLFTRGVIKDLAFEAFGPECNFGLDRKSVVLETEIMGVDSGSGGTDQLDSKYNVKEPVGGRKKDRKSKDSSQNVEMNSKNGSGLLDIDQFKIDFDNPDNSTFIFDTRNQKSLRDRYTYLVIYAKTGDIDVGPPSEGETRFRRDAAQGVYHVTSGLDRGLLKSVSFNKASNVSKYLRSARIQENRELPDLQLANLFEINAEMYGNALFWPGTYMYLNTRGLGSDLLGDPADNQTPSPANILGIGGYHQIKRVDNTINASGFSTKVSAMFVKSGDGRPKNLVKSPTPPELVNKSCEDNFFAKAKEQLNDALLNTGEDK